MKLLKKLEMVLLVQMLQGSTFTLSNFGIFDALIGTPIINQPNVGILGTGKIIKKPVVIEKDDKDMNDYDAIVNFAWHINGEIIMSKFHNKVIMQNSTMESAHIR